MMRLLRALSMLLLLLVASTPRPSSADPLQPITVAPGVFVFPGAPEAPSPANAGMVENQGVIVGNSGIVVIGTGSSETHGERLLQAIAGISDKPVVLAINLHATPEHVLGNTAFARRGIAILAHRETDRFMVANCTTCIRNLNADIGTAPLAAARLEQPSQLIDSGTSLTVGGRQLDILYYGWTQQPGSIVVFDRTSGVLFGGALVTLDVLPDAHNADVAAWLAALDKLKRLPVKTVVPGRGPVSPPRRIDEVGSYLRELLDATGRAYAQGISLGEAARTAAVPRFERWAMYSTLHPRNVHHVYLKLEERELGK